MIIGVSISVPALSRPSGGTTDFQMTVATTTSDETFTIPCRNVGTFDAVIDWGDGSTSTITAYDDADLTHTYASAGDHQISISGTFPNIYFNSGGDRLKVKSVENLGVVGWTRLDNAFPGCSNMTSFVAGTTDTSGVTSTQDMLANCPNLASVNFSGFITSNVTNMTGMFFGCPSLTHLDVTGFNTSSVVGTGFIYMFTNCSSLTSLDVTNFDTSGATNLQNMFSGCSSLTLLDVSNFNTLSVANMNAMFANCSSLTDIIGVEDFNIENFAFTGGLTGFANNVTLPTSRYDALLINWDAQEPFDGMSPNFGNSTYTAGGAAAAARANLISNDGWTITDGGTA